MTTPYLTTDQLDYALGSTAVITAGGFGIGDNLYFQITVIDPASGATIWSGPSWNAIEGDDGAGNGFLATNFFVTPDYANTTIQLTATDALTGQVVTTFFTDAPPPAGPPALGAASPNIISLTTQDALVERR